MCSDWSKHLRLPDSHFTVTYLRVFFLLHIWITIILWRYFTKACKHAAWWVQNTIQLIDSTSRIVSWLIDLCFIFKQTQEDDDDDDDADDDDDHDGPAIEAQSPSEYSSATLPAPCGSEEC